MYKHVARLFNNLPIHYKLFLITTIPLISLILFSIVTYINVQRFSQDEERLNNLYLTQKTAAQYMQLVDDMESGFRGYVLTEDARDLRPYQEALENLRGIGQELKGRLSEGQQQHFKEAEALVSQNVAEKEGLIRELHLGHKAIVLQYIKEGRGRAL
ncbi:MAG TPA: CHASE3 domain-containing protein, partial [Nitrospiraceae bacterium]